MGATLPFSTHLEPPHDTMPAMWDATVAEHGERPFIHSFEDTLTFAQADARVRVIAAELHRRGVSRGDRVALYLQNDPLFLLALVAIWRVGGVMVPINPMNTAHELRYHLEDSGAKALVTIPDLWESVAAGVVGDTAVEFALIGAHRAWSPLGTDAPAGSVPPITEVALPEGLGVELDLPGAGDCERVAVVEVAPGPVAAAPGGELPDPGLTGESVAVLSYTSGTTGKPKGAMNTHGNLTFNSESYVGFTGLQAGEPILGIAPLFHITGLVGHITLAIRIGAPVVLSHRFQPEVMLESVRRWQPVFTIGAITALMALADCPQVQAGADGGPSPDFASFKVLYSGGAPIAPALQDRLEGIFGAYIHGAFGMSETASPVVAVPQGERAPVDPESGALALGKAIYDTTVKVLDDDGNPVPDGTYGELAAAGPQIIPGYWNRPDANATTFHDGMLKTGDIGFKDADGWFYLVDRKKDMINASGYKVWPREVEDVLYGHPAVSEVAGGGVPDEYRGETVKAFVALKAGTTATPEEIVAYGKEHMSAYKYPRQVEVVDELPKTATGKILRRVLRDQ